jgi:hypothetical protein
MRNTADVIGGKPIAVLLQSISGVSAINPLVAFYDIHGGKREVLFFYFVPDTTRDIFMNVIIMFKLIFKIKKICSFSIVTIKIKNLAMLRKIHGTNFFHIKFLSRTNITCQNVPVQPFSSVYLF